MLCNAPNSFKSLLEESLGMVEWVGLEGTFRGHPVQLSCIKQGHFQIDQTFIQFYLEDTQGQTFCRPYSYRTRGNGFKSKESKFKSEIRKIFFYSESVETLKKVAQRGVACLIP